jgi:hypothetical protein
LSLVHIVGLFAPKSKTESFPRSSGMTVSPNLS